MSKPIKANITLRNGSLTPEGPTALIEVWQHPSTLSTVLCYLALLALFILAWMSRDE